MPAALRRRKRTRGRARERPPTPRPYCHQFPNCQLAGPPALPSITPIAQMGPASLLAALSWRFDHYLPALLRWGACPFLGYAGGNADVPAPFPPPARSPPSSGFAPRRTVRSSSLAALVLRRLAPCNVQGLDRPQPRARRLKINIPLLFVPCSTPHSGPGRPPQAELWRQLRRFARPAGGARLAGRGRQRRYETLASSPGLAAWRAAPARLWAAPPVRSARRARLGAGVRVAGVPLARRLAAGGPRCLLSAAPPAAFCGGVWMMAWCARPLRPPDESQSFFFFPLHLERHAQALGAAALAAPTKTRAPRRSFGRAAPSSGIWAPRPSLAAMTTAARAPRRRPLRLPVRPAHPPPPRRPRGPARMRVVPGAGLAPPRSPLPKPPPLKTSRQGRARPASGFSKPLPGRFRGPWSPLGRAPFACPWPRAAGDRPLGRPARRPHRRARSPDCWRSRRGVPSSSAAVLGRARALWVAAPSSLALGGGPSTHALERRPEGSRAPSPPLQGPSPLPQPTFSSCTPRCPSLGLRAGSMIETPSPYDEIR